MVSSSSGGDVAAALPHPLDDGVAGALAHGVPVEVDAAHARLRAELDEGGLLGVDVPPPDAVVLGQHDDRAALGRLVGERGELGGVGELLLGHAGHGDELGGLPVAERDRARLVEQQGVDVAGRLDGSSRHGQHVVLHEPVHAGDADGRQQAADRRRDEADEQGDQHRGRLRRVAVDGERLQRHDHDQEDDRQAGQQDGQGDLVGRLLALGALDQGDHAVEEGLAGVGGDLDPDLVGEHLGAAGDGAAIAAALADHRRRLAGDGRLVDRGDALDDVAVAGDDLAGRDDDHVAPAQLRRRHLLDALVGDEVGEGLGLHLAQRVGLRLAAALGHGRGEVGEEHGEPEPAGHGPDEGRVAASPGSSPATK